MREYINLAEIQLFPEMNEKIVELLMIRNDDVISMYSAKLIMHLQAIIKKGENRDG